MFKQLKVMTSEL